MKVRGIHRRVENFLSILLPSSMLSTKLNSSFSLLISSVPKSSSASSSLPISSLRFFCCGKCNLFSRVGGGRSSSSFLNNEGNEKCQKKYVVGNSGNVLTLLKRYFGYYRFHKQIGRGHWSRYQERYMRPRSLEHTQRLMFNYSPRFQDSKRSAQWLWNLPKRIACATTSDEVLDVWVYYRHKRKRPYHYLMVLKRLVDVGGCDPSDWRFRLIASHVTSEAFAGLKFQEYSYFELCSILIRRNLTSKCLMEPKMIAQMLDAFFRLKIHDILLLETVLAHVRHNIFDYPPKCVAIIGKCTSSQLPLSLPHVRETHQEMLQFLSEHTNILDLDTIEKTASFIDNTIKVSPLNIEQLNELMERVKSLKDDSKSVFDVANLLEIFVSHGIKSRHLYDILYRHIHRHLVMFEPIDFLRAARSMFEVFQLTEFKDERCINAVSRHFLRHGDEFTDVDYNKIVKFLIQIGPPSPRYLQKFFPLRKVDGDENIFSAKEMKNLKRHLKGEDLVVIQNRQWSFTSLHDRNRHGRRRKVTAPTVVDVSSS